MKEEPRLWMPLDNAAKIFPSAATDRLTQLFRLSVTLKEAVDPSRLRSALHATLGRFPVFQVRLRPGVFWFSLVHEPSLPEPYPDTRSPCMPFRRSPRHLFRVRWFGRRLAVEFDHTLTDGRGAMVFVRALTAEYLHQGGAVSLDPEDVRRAARSADPEEANDGFQALRDPTAPRFTPWNRAFRLPVRLLPRGQYAVTTGVVPLDATLLLAKARGATLTEYLAATLLAAYQDRFEALPPALKRRYARPLRLVLPVDLRPVFASATLRNFFVVVPVEVDLRLGAYGFDELVRKVHHQLQAEMDAKLLKKQVVRNLRGELNPMARVLPLPVKNLVLSAVYGSHERRHTASLSNLGRVTWPEPWSEAVERVEFVPPPSPHCPANVGVVSVGNQLALTFGSLSRNPAVERAFFTRLRRQGLPVAVTSNRPLEED